MRELTREEVLAMVPGYDLDVLAAEKVMGWKVDGSHVNKNGYIAYMADFKASKDISAAWEVVEKMRGTHWVTVDCGMSIHNPKVNPFSCSIGKYGVPGSKTADALTAPLAICRAALLAVLEATP